MTDFTLIEAGGLIIGIATGAAVIIWQGNLIGELRAALRKSVLDHEADASDWQNASVAWMNEYWDQRRLNDALRAEIASLPKRAPNGQMAKRNAAPAVADLQARSEAYLDQLAKTVAA